MKTAKVLTEEDLTPPNLKKILEGIYIDSDLNERGHLIVHADPTVAVLITLNKYRKLLQLQLAFDNLNLQLGVENVNRMNNNYNLGRFSVSEEGDTLFIDFDLPYIGGVTPWQLLAVLRTLSTVAPAAILEEVSRIQQQQEPSTSTEPVRVLN
jgi:hypothetical protein